MQSSELSQNSILAFRLPADDLAKASAGTVVATAGTRNLDE